MSRHSIRLITIISTLSILLATANCAPVRMMANYDALIDSGATQIQKKIDTFLIAQERTRGTPEASYANSLSWYESLGVDMDLLRDRARLQNKNEDTVVMIDKLEQNLELLKRIHQHYPEGIPQSEIPTLRTGFDVPCQAIIKLELAKKRE